MVFALSELAQDNADLLRKLAHFSFPHMARLGAAMLVMPEFQQNSLRLEAFVHLAAIGCRGSDTPTNDHLQKSLTALAPPSLAQHEDPPTDVFVGSANSYLGSFRLFIGSYNDGDFWVERLLNHLTEKQNFPPFERIVESTVSILRLSDAIAGRLQLDRYASGKEARKTHITVPKWREMLPRINSLYFSANDLLALNIQKDHLAEFVLDDNMRTQLVNQSLWGSILEARPLLRFDGGILVIAPSSLARTAVRYMVDKIHESGMGGWSETFYDQEVATTFVNQSKRRLHIEDLDFEPPIVEDMLPIYPYFGTFDEGKVVILLTLNPPFLTEAHFNLESIDELSPAEIEKINSYLQHCIHHFQNHPAFSGGMVLVCLGGIGRSIGLSLRAIPSPWALHVANLAEWQTLLSSGDCSAMRLFKLGEHERFAADHSVTIKNLWGLVELFAYWKASGFRLIPRDTGLGNMSMLILDGSFSRQFHENLRRLLDIHCVPTPGGNEVARLERFEANATFKEDKEQKVYCDTIAISNGRLRGCVETINRLWWVSVANTDVPNAQRHTVYEMWKCVLHWAWKLSPVAEDVIDKLPTGPLAIDLDFSALATWRKDDVANMSMPLPQEVTALASGSGTITLQIPEGFLSHFNQPKNTAERAIVRILFEHFARLANTVLSPEDIEAALCRVIPNEDARYFHVVLTQDLRRLLNVPFSREPLFISEEDVSFSQLGLGFLGHNEGPRQIKGKPECQQFIEKVVDTLWQRIEARLREFNLLSIATNCMRAIVELEKDKDHWELSSRALLALHADRVDAHAVITNRNSERALAIMCNRLLIEIAQYSGKFEEGKLFNTSTHLGLLADCSNLLGCAQHRDAISYGFMDATVQIANNGELLVDMAFYDNVMIQYISKHSERQTEQAAANYDEYFEPIRQYDPSDAEKPLPPDLLRLNVAFKAEYGVDFLTYFKISNALSILALKKGKDALLFNDLGWMKFLQDRCKLSLETGRELLNALQLPIRPAFDKDLPHGCHISDSYPWRFRRKLSLLGRPLVQVRAKPGNWLTFATSFDTSVRYLVGHIERGAFPQAYFKSKEMRAYMGEVANRLGHEFTARVAKLFVDSGFVVRTEVEMSSLGASKHAGLGDVDVLAWNQATGRIYAVECKRLRPAFTVREVVQRIEEYKGDQKERDSLGRHTRRIDLLLRNLSNLCMLCGIPISQIRLIPLLVTSDIVPMQFFDNLNFPSSQVVSFEGLPTSITAR